MTAEAPRIGPLIRLKRRLYVILEAGKTGDIASAIFDWFMVTLIVANVIAFTAETVPEVSADWGRELQLFNSLSIAIFTIEYFLRLWVCTEHPPLRHRNPITARLGFALNPAMIIDLVVILPFYLNVLIGVDLRVLRIVRLLRFLKLVRFSPALTTLFNVMVAERRALLGAIIIMFGLLVLSASAIHFVEGPVQPDQFGTIPDSMWWAVATLTTVGYGDVVPITMVGRIIGGVVMIFGLGMFALPIGIIATGFSQEIHRREFVVNWGLVARVPTFSELSAAEIAEVMELLQTQVVPRDTLIVRAGDPAEAMYFVSLGHVEAQLAEGPVTLGEGDHFGEIALLRHVNHVATIRALSQVHLLVLDAFSLRALMARNPKLGDRIREKAEDRFRHAWGKSSGELLAEELRRKEKTDPETEEGAEAPSN